MPSLFNHIQVNIEAAEDLVDEEEQFLVDHRLGHHAKLEALGDHTLELSVMEVVHYYLQLFDHPLDDCVSFLIYLAILQ